MASPGNHGETTGGRPWQFLTTLERKRCGETARKSRTRHLPTEPDHGCRLPLRERASPAFPQPRAGEGGTARTLTRFLLVDVRAALSRKGSGPTKRRRYSLC